ncbi:hypothetical protein ES707_19590 [subsurface metagenome]
MFGQNWKTTKSCRKPIRITVELSEVCAKKDSSDVDKSVEVKEDHLID